MLEAAIEDRLCQTVRGLGGDAFKWGVNGWPDRIIVLPPARDGVLARIGFLETKRPGEEPTALQERNLRVLRGWGCFADWAASHAQVTAFMERLVKR